MNWEQKTAKLKQYFDDKKREPVMTCQAVNKTEDGGRTQCRQKMNPKEIWRRVKETIRHARINDSTHPLEQFEKRDDVFYTVCPSCEAGADFA
jgi:hypothetical protein